MERGWAVLPVLALALIVSACGSSSNEPAAAPRLSSAPQQVVSFDAGAGALPEGVAIVGESAYVGFAPTGEIVKVALGDHSVTAFGSLPTPVSGKGFMSGVFKDDRDPYVYAAMVSFGPEVVPGIYRVGPEGGSGSLFARHAEVNFPNGFARDESGRLFVTDSAAGAIFLISEDGQMEKWLTHDALRGDRQFCGEAKFPFDIGVNGIASQGGVLYATNTDRATVLRIGIASDGSPGQVSEWAAPGCKLLSGADGLALDAAGNAYVAANHLNQVVRISESGKASLVASGAPLDFPASLVFSGPDLYVTNFAFLSASTGNANPGLISFKAQ